MPELTSFSPPFTEYAAFFPRCFTLPAESITTALEAIAFATAILVDIVLTKNGTIQALRPVYDSKNPIPVREPEKSEWLKIHANTDRIQKRIIGNIGGSSLHRVKQFVNYCQIGNNIFADKNNATIGIGSILVCEDDFVKLL